MSEHYFPPLPEVEAPNYDLLLQWLGQQTISVQKLIGGIEWSVGAGKNTRLSVGANGDLTFFKADGSTISLLWDESDNRWEFAAKPTGITHPDHGLISRTYYTSDSTWTKADTSADHVFMVVSAIGGGGGGGGADKSGSGKRSEGAGGGGGGYSQLEYNAAAIAALGTTESITVGAAGSGGNTNGGNGGSGSSVLATGC